MSARFVFGSSASYLVVMVAERAASLLLFPLMTRILTPADYGAMLLIGNGAALVNLLFGYCLAQALPTLFSNAPSDSLKRVVSTTIELTIGATLFMCYLAVVLAARPLSIYFLHTDAYAGAIALGAVSSFLSACSICLVWVLRLTERHRLYPMVQLPALGLQVGLIVSFIVAGSLTVSSQYIAVAAAGLVTTASYAICLRHWLSGRYELQQLANAARIGAQMLPWQIAIVLTTNSAAFFLTRSGHVDEAGLFLVAFTAASLLITVSNSFDSVWTPFVLLRKDQPDIAQIQVRIFSLYSSALLAAASGLCLFSHELFVVLAGPKFREGYHLVPALALACCVYCFANSFAQGLQARQRNIYYTWIGIATSLVFLGLCVPLAKPWGQYGIVVAMGGSFSVMLVMLQLISGRFMPVRYPWGRHGLMWLVAVAIVAYTYPIAISWPGAAAKGLALVAIAILPFLFGVTRASDLRRFAELLSVPTR